MERTERGSALPVLVLAVVLGGALALQIGRLGGAAGSRARAQTAADAAALAGAVDGEPAARALAEANGATLVGFEERGLDTRVVVELASARASGKARRQGARAAVAVVVKREGFTQAFPVVVGDLEGLTGVVVTPQGAPCPAVGRKGGCGLAAAGRRAAGDRAVRATPTPAGWRRP